MKFVCYQCTNEELVARSKQCIDDSVVWLAKFRGMFFREGNPSRTKSERFPRNEQGFGSSTTSSFARSNKPAIRIV
jgi:hypothetical protein